MPRYLIFPVLLLFLLVSLSFTPVDGTRDEHFPGLVRQAEKLTTVAEAVQRGELPLDSLRATVASARLAYKRSAWLLEYAYPSFAAKHLNGAPLLKIKREGITSTVVRPQGLQVLDEAVYAAGVDAAGVAILARQLHVNAVRLSSTLASRTFTPAETIAAARMAIIGLTTLGLTGFDTPGSVAALAEAEVTLQSIAEAFATGTKLGNTPPATEVRRLLARGQSLLANEPDFDAFDRLRFIREVTEPTLRILRGSATPASGPPTALNPMAKSMFSDEFLNPYAYTELTAAEDNDALRKLGKALFYDQRLSATGTLSCASCHRPELAFTDGVARSASNQVGLTVTRNAPTLLNAVYADRYFYDLRAFTLEQQAEHVVFDGAEFGTAYATIVGKINTDQDYKQLVRAALGQRQIDRAGFRAALASYVLSLRSFNSPFDRFARGETDALNPAAYRGFNLFMGKAACGTCHFAPTFSGLVPPAYVENETEILGVPASPHRLRLELDNDRGRAAGGVHYEDAWIYERSFKTPTVRNVAETAPYFHHGTYATLNLVVDFYNRGGGTGLGLEVPNQTLPPDPLGLTVEEQTDLIAFMRSLSDKTLISR